MSEVRLVDLEVIKRYSLAIRQETVPAEELLDALDASRALVVAAMGAGAPAKRGSGGRRAATPSSGKAPA